jgi:magnesium chelatase subunit D
MGNPALLRCQLALTLLAIAPFALGGACLRGRAGGARDIILRDLNAFPAPQHRLPPDASDARLFGGLDLAATLSSGTIAHSTGALANARTLILPMAERITPGLAGRLSGALDGGTFCVLALDEGVDDEALHPALADRLAFSLDLDEIRATAAQTLSLDSDSVADARTMFSRVTVQPDQILELATLTLSLGISSLRAPHFALTCARAHAAFFGRDHVTQDDMIAAVELTLAHRATQLPETDPPPPPPPDDEDETPPDETPESEDLDLPDDLLLEAVKAALPAGLLERLATGAARSAIGSGSGARTKSNRRGRPLPARPGRPDQGKRIDVISTLRAAAPWQKLRNKGDGPVRVWPSDIHIKHYEQTSDRLLIFTVDASGSAAIARLAEAKGAIELLLSEAYARRDHVALIAFRGTEADVLLPPTRSLVQTKRRLAALPGGGGTPLAHGLEAALTLSLTARGRGLTPTLVLLTDGRANIDRQGKVDRPQAATDAQTIARAIRGQGIDALVIDTGNRPEPALSSLSQTLNATYLPLPRADARRLSAAVSDALDQ